MKKLLILNIICVLACFSCEDYLDVNEDPNNPTVVSPELVLPVAQVYTAEYLLSNRRANHLGNMFMYNWSESYGFSWYDDEFNYQVTSTFYQNLFNDAYLRALKQYTDLEFLEPEYNNYKAIAMIMKSYHYQLLVDFYGDVPYSEALLRGENATPVYDAGNVIYADLLVKLTDAIALIDATAQDELAEDVGQDIIFDGDMLKWKQFANTIKMRILVRTSDVTSSSEIQSAIDAINAEGSGFITGTVSVQPGYLQEENKQNPFWNGLGWDFSGNEDLNHQATCATQFILDYLINKGDPRIDVLFAAGDGGHLGVEQGLHVGPEFGSTHVSLIGDGLLKDFDMNAPIFTLAESNFNLAEAALKGFGGNPKTFYENGVKASFIYLGLDNADAESYLSQGFQNVNYDQSANKLEAIITQKWLGLQGVSAEQSWFDYSRTGFPAGLPISNQASTPERPVRLLYPSSEITGNASNVPAQKNAFTDKIFWAQ